MHGKSCVSVVDNERSYVGDNVVTAEKIKLNSGASGWDSERDL
jgi:hypothetical protein